jgi:predicted DNA-binding antitoxin AbrB/MazE fold protein
VVCQTVDAVYENGVLRPLTALTGVPEHGTVRVTVTPAIAGDEAQRPLANCVGILPDADAREMRIAIEREFAGVDLNEWK